MALTGAFLANQPGRRLWLHAMNTILFNFEAVMKMRNFKGLTTKVPYLESLSNKLAFLKDTNVPYLPMRDGDFPTELELKQWSRKNNSANGWLMYLSTPIWVHFNKPEKVMRAYFEKNDNRMNVTMRRYWTYRPCGEGPKDFLAIEKELSKY